jgi:hypothetical protein
MDGLRPRGRTLHRAALYRRCRGPGLRRALPLCGAARTRGGAGVTVGPYAAAHLSPFAHPDPGSRQVAYYTARLGNQNGFGTRHVTLHGTADQNASTRYCSEDDRFATERKIARDTHVALHPTENFERAVSSHITADDRGATND